MGDMLSQAEIDALLGGTSSPHHSDKNIQNEDSFSLEEIDALGEIGNISMGTAATTLFTLLENKVMITTPKVRVTTLEQLAKDYVSPYVAVKIEYTDGLTGSNLLILKTEDVKVLTDLMMGGEGQNIPGELTELHLSAISEAMNQMVGSSATSMSSMFNKRIEISPPKAFVINFDSPELYDELEGSEKIVSVAFKMVVDNYIDSEIMQILPIHFAKDLVRNLINQQPEVPDVQDTFRKQAELLVEGPSYDEPHYTPTSIQQQDYGIGAVKPEQTLHESNKYEMNRNREPVSIQPAHFQSFDESRTTIEKKNISLIMDVPLQVTVELGRTQKMIKDILEFGSGSIIELDKLAGEPVDILVNGKSIAKGEVVVIDESFGVRITDIIHPSKRL